MLMWVYNVARLTNDKVTYTEASLELLSSFSYTHGITRLTCRYISP